MNKNILRTAALSAVIGLGAVAPVSALTLEISITNNSSNGGVTLTPLYSAFHDGTFDTFNSGEAASAGLEALAEDGNAMVIAGERLAAHPNSVGNLTAAPQGFAGAPLIEPGETGTSLINVDGSVNQFFSFLSMILPSNDQFIGNDDATAYRLFDAAGTFLGNQVINVTGAMAYDAGTEVNNGIGNPFGSVAAGTASDEGGVVGPATGIDIFAGLTLPNGQVLDLNAINYAGNGAFDLATIRISAVPVPAALPLMLLGFGALGAVARRRSNNTA